MDSNKLSMLSFSFAPILFLILGTIVYKLNINSNVMILFSILYLFAMCLIDMKLDK